MPGPPLSDEKRTAILNCKAKNPKWSCKKIGQACGVSHGTVSNVLCERPPEEVREVSGDSQTISLPKTRIHTLEDLLAYCKVDTQIWEVEKFICNKWEVGAIVGSDKDRRMNVEPLYQIKAWLKKRKEIEAARTEIEKLKELAAKWPRKPKPIKRKPSAPNMLEINIPDLHIGKMAWARETGYTNYDSKIACDLFREALATLLDRVKGHSFEQVLFIVGNDLLHSDGTKGQTFNGTPLDNDSRYHKTFDLARTLMVEAIERLREVAPVKVLMVQGNHDTMSVWHLGDSLQCWFRKYSDVEIDNSPRTRKYHQFGQVGLMFTHGDKGKKDRYPLLLATEERKMFGATKFNEIHTGHLHKTQLDEHNGIRVRVLPALCDADAWHSENGFVGNLRNAEAYIWNKETGLIGTAIYSAPGQ